MCNFTQAVGSSSEPQYFNHQIGLIEAILDSYVLTIASVDRFPLHGCYSNNTGSALDKAEVNAFWALA
jgi:hypothetical protein